MNKFVFLPIFNSDLGFSAKLVYLYLERHGGRKGRCFHSTQTMADNLSISRRTVFRALDELEREGYVSITARYRINGGKTSNQYALLK